MGEKSELDALIERDPAEVARQLVEAAAASGHPEWAGHLAGALDLLGARSGAGRESVARFLALWGLSDAEAGRLLAVSRQAVAKWRVQGPPERRRLMFADLSAVTDLLVRYVKVDRIPAVVRRSAPFLGDRAMVDFVATGRTGELLALTRDMFDLRRLDAA